MRGKPIQTIQYAGALRLKAWNQLKIEILKVVQRNSYTTAKEVAQSVSISEDLAQMALCRYYRQGLLHREKKLDSPRKPSFLYSLTARGLGRLAYLEKP